MTEEEDKKKVFPFHEMGLDDRILKAIAKLGWVEPTLIQERAVPLIMEGKDLLARSRSCFILFVSTFETQGSNWVWQDRRLLRATYSADLGGEGRRHHGQAGCEGLHPLSK